MRRRWLAILGLVGSCLPYSLCAQAPTAASDAFRVPPGFAVELFADDDLAHDIFSLTHDARGRVVVSGPGYIKTLHDDDHDGRADRATIFSEFPHSGAQGLCFVGRRLLATGDDGLLEFSDANDDGVADGPPTIWVPLRIAEHGAHGIVQGPDGWLYLVCGNETRLPGDFVTSDRSPATAPRCGCIVRISLDGKQREILADGFRNPYDIDFTADGKLLTVDSDGERDQHLPWYEPTRMFDVAQGMQHGWLDGGWTKSWSRPEYFFDSMDRVCELGRGSPTGVAVYRHDNYPPRYRGGAFSACWTLGRIYFVPLEPAASTVQGRPEIFAATQGELGFAPVDLAVNPHGEIDVAVGGRRTRGGVFRIRYVGETNHDSKTRPKPDDQLLAVLNAVQPLAAWSRTNWEPIARSLGRKPFEIALLDERQSSTHRVRAIEILTEHFGGLALDLAAKALESRDPAVSARVAWSLARSANSTVAARAAPGLERRALLAVLTHGESPVVQRAAWEALAAIHRPPLRTNTNLDWKRAMASSDRRVRGAALKLAKTSGAEDYLRQPKAASPDVSYEQQSAALRITAPPEPAACVQLALRADSPAIRLEALRLFQLALGDVVVDVPATAGLPGYSVQQLPPDVPASQWASQLGGLFLQGDRRVDREVARCLAILKTSPPNVKTIVARQAVEEPAAAVSLHYLISLAQIDGPADSAQTRATATALVGLHDKLAARQEFPSRNWSDAVGKTIDQLLAVDPMLGEAIVSAEGFGRAEHVLFVSHLPVDQQRIAARRLFEHARQANDSSAWTEELIDALHATPVDALPREEVLTALRPHWDDFRLRDAIASWLAEIGGDEDRAKLIEALGSTQPDVVRKSALALRRQVQPATAAELAAALQAMRQAWSGKPLDHPSGAAGKDRAIQAERQLWAKQTPVRDALVELLRHWSGQQAIASEYDAWADWFLAAHPAEARQFSSTAADPAAWSARLAKIDWNQGRADVGERLFAKQACHRCHLGDNRLGPDLKGAAARMSREDLFAAIYDPQREVAPPYRTTLLATKSGQVHHGLIIYESPDGTLLQTSPDTTIRITGDELLTTQASSRSLMPNGLLDAFGDQDLADLAAFLTTLAPSSAVGQTTGQGSP